ncbi:bifunctional DNA-binding transcriptional regulator/O6-methylguanine-DNA methyltransferase Ada [Azospirillum sp. B506]|uniref:bifunctional DNA-binding transcriptional regulator/O6-methylguanine-DNA methyltransferase Ada n=1 Tax=Azospirillum sp. B506 TaxID=137721 RepID=UPI0003452CC3|nr:bifunctional DNA-binding transcriptional regulator/O6-methylguanine-DNA methyltransferase Ada [Azospirillum sp. B506]
MTAAPDTAAPDAIDPDVERWASLRRRDPAADGRFVYAVRSTGVYCRPSCAARSPRPENVVFYTSNAEAEQAGFRPCKRCRPDGPSQSVRRAEAVAAACRLIEEAEEVPHLEELAAAAGMSPHHFHRIFKQVTGVTPRAYVQAHRAARVVDVLQQAGSVTEAIYEAGYGSSGRFYESAGGRLGMTPTSYRKGGVGETIRFAVGVCSLGSILVAATERGVCAILLGDDPDMLLRDLQERFSRAELIGGDADFEATVAQVVGFVEAPGMGLGLPLDIGGTAFQQRVWQALRAIPAGRTASYAEIADAIGEPAAVRAVARACGANPLAVAIPCHRVVRSDGGLSGYRWGVERKRDLLDRERREAVQ